MIFVVHMLQIPGQLSAKLILGNMTISVEPVTIFVFQEGENFTTVSEVKIRRLGDRPLSTVDIFQLNAAPSPRR